MKTISSGRTNPDSGNRPEPMLVGQDVEVPLVDGSSKPYINLDYAASAPALVEVARKLDAFLPYYSSVHRGAGFKSQISTAAYEGAREVLRHFFGAREDDLVIITRNTTDSLNLMANVIPKDVPVVAFTSEHHANLLSWQAGAANVHYLPMPRSSVEAIEVLASYLEDRGSSLVTVTGASNVTGEIWPVAELARVAHEHGSRICLDAAQMAPHLPIDMMELGVDYLAASGHKLYAPYGAGVLIGRPDWLEEGDPYLRGGGAVDFVTPTEVLWSKGPARQEAGSPNVVGAVAMALACEALDEIGMDNIAAEEIALADYARRQLGTVKGIELYRLWAKDVPRIGVVTFNLQGYEHSQLATILSAEYGIGVRHGCFCAHPLILDLLNVDQEQAASLRAQLKTGGRPRLPGAVRMSLGIGSTSHQIDELVAALTQIARIGAKWTYVVDPLTGEYEPSPDPRAWPNLGVALKSRSNQ